jgi:uncharacterized protein (UPF0276 family)
MYYADLPVLGIGLGCDVSSVMPDFRSFLIKSSDSHIDYLNVGAHYVQQNRLRHYIDDLVKAGFPMVFHPINFNVSLADREQDSLCNAVSDIARYLNAIWAGQDVAIWTFGAQYLGAYLVPPVLDDSSVAAVASKVMQLNSTLSCPFLIENPPINFSMESMHVLDFIGRVSEEADCGIVLDIGHLIGYQRATGRTMTDMPLRRFPFRRVVEVHLAGLQFSRVGDDVNIIDQHAYPVHELCWSFLRENIHNMTGLRGLTLEQEYCETDAVREHLSRARRLCEEEKLLLCV